MIFAVLTLVSFRQVVLGVATFFYRDYANFAYPMAMLHREAFWRGELPLWNPYNYCGIPCLAQWNTLTLYPGSLFYLIFPLSWSLGVFCLLHWGLGALGMYHLAHRWTGKRLAAGVAGMGFGFNGVVWHCVMFPNYLVALGWMPWVLLAVGRSAECGIRPSSVAGPLRRMESAECGSSSVTLRRRLGDVNWGGRRIVVAALVGTMQMLSGVPELILITWMIAGLLWLVQSAEGGVSRTRSLAQFAVVPLLVAGLAAVQLLPFFRLLAHSHRDTGFGAIGDVQGSLPPDGWLNYLVPLLHEVQTPEGVFVQRGQYFLGSYYLGTAIVVLALLAVWRVRRREVWLMAGLTVAGLVLALGPNGFAYTALKGLVPQIGFMRFPAKFLLLPTFALPALAAFGAAWLQSLPAARWPFEKRKFILLAFLVLAGIVLIIRLAWQSPLEGDLPAVTAADGVVRMVFLGAITAALIVLCNPAAGRQRTVLTVAVLAFLWFDNLTHVPALSPLVPRTAYEANVVRKHNHWESQLHPGESRAMDSLAAMRQLFLEQAPDPAVDFDNRRFGLSADYNVLDHLPKVEGSFSLYLGPTHEVVTRLYLATNDLPGLKDFLGISHITNPTNLTDWSRRDSFMPLVAAGQEPVFLEDAAALQAVTDPAFQPRETVVLPSGARADVTAVRSPNAKIVSQRCTAQQLEFEVESPAAAIVTVAQSDYPCWRAYVDGRAVPVWRANYAFQALQVPAGRHAVKLAYEDRALKLGVFISLLTLAVCAMLWARSDGDIKPGTGVAEGSQA